MKLLGVRLARSIWLTPQYFLNPQGLFLRRASVELKDRYEFLKGPFDNATIGTPDVKYEGGGFKTASGTTIQIISLTLHGDGIVVDTMSSTDYADAFLEDVFRWLGKDYGLPSPTDSPIKRIYVSELNVAFEKAADFLNPKLKAFVDLVSATIGDEQGGGVGFLGFQLTTDPTRTPRPNVFRMDREINTSIEDNRFYSLAPVKTGEHIQLLEKLEASL